MIVFYVVSRYDGRVVDLRHETQIKDVLMPTKKEIDSWGQHIGPVIELGIDLSEFYLNVEWDVMKVPARRHMIHYTGLADVCVKAKKVFRKNPKLSICTFYYNHRCISTSLTTSRFVAKHFSTRSI